jgi:sarcosine oxidase subunit delta
MKIMKCPLNGPRNIDEFTYFGPVKQRPDIGRASDKEWTDYIFLSPNPVGILREWWCHAPTNFFFIAERHTLTDEIMATYPPGELQGRMNAVSKGGGEA